MNTKTDEITKESAILSDETGLLMGNNQQADSDASATPKSQKSKTKTIGSGDANVMGMKSDLSSKVEELSFAERLGQPSQPAKQTQAAPVKTAGGKTEAPRVASNVAVLTAALASNDKHQLQMVLDQQDPRVISATVRSLPLTSVLPLLSEVMSRFSRKPSSSLAGWLRFILITHQAYLTSLPNLISRLGALYNSLDDRLKYFNDLLRLHGRFELMISHMEMNKSVSADENTALNTYLEGPEDEDFDDDSDSSSDDDEEDFDDDEEDVEEKDGKEDMDVDSGSADEQSGSDEDGSDDDSDE